MSGPNAFYTIGVDTQINSLLQMQLHKSNNAIRQGDFVIGLEGASIYTLSSPGILCYVNNSTIDSAGKVTLLVYPLRDELQEPKQTLVDSAFFRLATDEEVLIHLRTTKEIYDSALRGDLQMGDSVLLGVDLKVDKHGGDSTGQEILRKGTLGIVDPCPGETPKTENKDDQNNASVSGKSPLFIIKPYTGWLTSTFRYDNFIGPRVNVFFPDSEQTYPVPIRSLQKKASEFKDVKLVLPSDYMDRIMAVCGRVINPQIHDYVYDKLALGSVCQKGRGAVVLLHGPPGTGKTMTAEVLADRLQRPLIKIALSGISGGENLAARLRTAFARARRYNAILLLDEVDVFIRSRGGSHPIFDDNTSMFLRVLEYYDGILMMTTNLVKNIDEAVFSRVHLILEFDKQTQADRKEIWKSMIPPQILERMRGTEFEHEKLFEELSTFEINGREIKTVIQNAICAAVAKHSEGYGVPSEVAIDGIKWMRPKYFLEEAKYMADRKGALSGKRTDL